MRPAASRVAEFAQHCVVICLIESPILCEFSSLSATFVSCWCMSASQRLSQNNASSPDPGSCGDADKDKDRLKKEKAAAAAEELSAGQARAMKAEMKRAKAAEADRKQKGSYLQVCTLTSGLVDI